MKFKHQKQVKIGIQQHLVQIIQRMGANTNVVKWQNHGCHGGMHGRFFGNRHRQFVMAVP